MGEGLHKRKASVPLARHVPLPQGMLRWLVTFLATGGYIGYMPRAPGTAGSILGLLAVKFALFPLWSRAAVILLLFGALTVIGCAVADSAERIFAQADSPVIVLDEMLGMIATMLLNPLQWEWLAAGFMLFRLFDIIKPWPASRFDLMRGGMAVVLDDIVAACYANGALQILRRMV